MMKLISDLIFRTDKEIGSIEAAHESIVWTLAWHPIGHILCSGSNDHTVKFWTRNRPGDQMRDKYNLNTLPPSLAGLEDYEMDEHVTIPGMGGMNEDRPDFDHPNSLNDAPPQMNAQVNISSEAASRSNGAIPGLDLDVSSIRDKQVRPMSRNLQTAEGKADDFYGITAHDPHSILTCVRDILGNIIHKMPGLVPLKDLQPEKIQIYGKDIDVIRKLNFNSPSPFND